jgi:hypothetical protein
MTHAIGQVGLSPCMGDGQWLVEPSHLDCFEEPRVDHSIHSLVSSHVPATTNSQAEYCGVLEGLRASQEHRWLPLDVAGDSQLIHCNTAPSRKQQLRGAVRRSPAPWRPARRETVDTPTTRLQDGRRGSKRSEGHSDE